MKGYTSEEKIENYILQDIDATFSTQIEGWIESVENIIDQITGRNFIADTVATARLYDGDGDGDRTLLIDDCVSVTKVEVGNDSYGSTFTEIESSGSDRYFLEPTNYSVKEIPITSVILNSRMWAEGKQNNQITAKWGYSAAVPSDIEFAATVLVAGILNQQRQGGDEIKSEKIGNFSVAYNSDNGQNSFADFANAMKILDRYKKFLL